MGNIVIQNSINSRNYQPSFTRRRRDFEIDKTPQEKLDRIYRSQGFLGKFFDNIQDTLGIGLSRKNLKTQLNSADKNALDKKLNQYYDQQKNETEIALDLITGLSAAGSFKFIKKLLSYSHAFNHNPKIDLAVTAVGIGISAVAGMITKPILKLINRLGTPKDERRRERTFLKDVGSGFVDGAAAPIAYAHKLGLLGAVGINSASRYIFNKKADKDDAFSNHITNGWIVKLPALGLAAFSAFKFHKKINILENAIIKSKENVKNITAFKSEKLPLQELIDLTKYNLKDKQTQKELIHTVRTGFFSKPYKKVTSAIRKLLRRKEYNTSLEVCEIVSKPAGRTLFATKDLITEQEMTNIMKEIEQYNLFYPKMIQMLPSNIENFIQMFSKDGKNPLEEILKASSEPVNEKNWFKRKFKKFGQKRAKYIAENGVKTVNDFLNNYKNKCPASRTVTEAQKFVENTYGKRFTIKGNKPLGVGTVAETFAAKDNETGKDVVIKMVKTWVSPEKLLEDKKNILKSLERIKKDLKPEEYDFQLKVINELYSAWAKELDMNLEAKAASLLGKYAVNYNTVAPIIVKDNIYIMDKANGVEFDKFVEYLDKNKIKITKNDASELMIKYFEVFFEQLLSVPKKGEKVMHADPHAGNIFIDLSNKAKPFTFIDTGNVMRFTPEEAIQNVTSHIDYIIGNSENIAHRLLKDAVLPQGMTPKEAEELLAKHLNETFYSGKYKITSDPFSTINNESMEFMKKNKVILSSKNTNLLKAEIAYLSNIMSIAGIIKHIDQKSTLNAPELEEQMKLMGKQIFESIKNGILNNKKCTFNELRSRIKYIDENPERFFTTLYSYIPPEKMAKDATKKTSKKAAQKSKKAS